MQIFRNPACFSKDPLQSPLQNCSAEKFLLMKRCLFAVAVERRKPQNSILFLAKVIQKTVTSMDFLDGLYLEMMCSIFLPMWTHGAKNGF